MPELWVKDDVVGRVLKSLGRREDFLSPNVSFRSSGLGWSGLCSTGRKVEGREVSEVACEEHRWELPGNYPVFTVVMVIYHYVERIWRILVTPIFIYNIYNH